MPKSKESTARITMFHELKIPFVFTLEASFAGSNKGKLSGQHFTIGDFENIGKNVLKTLYQIRNAEGNRKLIRELLVEIDNLNIKETNADSDESSSSESE